MKYSGLQSYSHNPIASIKRLLPAYILIFFTLRNLSDGDPERANILMTFSDGITNIIDSIC